MPRRADRAQGQGGQLLAPWTPPDRPDLSREGGRGLGVARLDGTVFPQGTGCQRGPSSLVPVHSVHAEPRRQLDWAAGLLQGLTCRKWLSTCRPVTAVAGAAAGYDLILNTRTCSRTHNFPSARSLATSPLEKGHHASPWCPLSQPHCRGEVQASTRRASDGGSRALLHAPRARV